MATSQFDYRSHVRTCSNIRIVTGEIVEIKKIRLIERKHCRDCL